MFLLLYPNSTVDLRILKISFIKEQNIVNDTLIREERFFFYFTIIK